MIKDEFDLWYEQAKPETIQKAKLKAIDQGNAYIRQALINPDERMLKALLRITWARKLNQEACQKLKSDDEVQARLKTLRDEPNGWENHGSYETKWDEVSRTTLRRQKVTPYTADDQLKDIWKGYTGED